jgi:hypothetical protein
MFRKSADPIVIIERELSGFRERKAALEARLEAADVELARAIEQRRQRLVEADVDEETGTRTRDLIASLRDTVNGLADALSEVGARLGSTESKLLAERERIERETASRELTKHVDTLAMALDGFATAGAALVAAVQSVAPRVEHANASPEWTSTMVESVGFAARALVDRGRSRAVMIAAGNVAILQPSPPRAEPAPEPEIPRQEIYSHRRVCWSEGDQVKTIEAWSFAWLPTAAAARALAANVASARGDNRTEKLMQIHGAIYGGGGVIPSAECFSVDELPAETAAA